MTDGLRISRIPFSKGVHYWNGSDPNISFNNVHIEHFKSQGEVIKNAYVGLAGSTWDIYNRNALNESAIAAYRRHGYSVIGIEGADNILTNGGSVRCVSKVMRKSITLH